MGYAQEYHVERYLRECFVPRIAPVSRVRIHHQSRLPITDDEPGNDIELCWRKSTRSTQKLLASSPQYDITPSLNSTQIHGVEADLVCWRQGLASFNLKITVVKQLLRRWITP